MCADYICKSVTQRDPVVIRTLMKSTVLKIIFSCNYLVFYYLQSSHPLSTTRNLKIIIITIKKIHKTKFSVSSAIYTEGKEFRLDADIARFLVRMISFESPVEEIRKKATIETWRQLQ